MRGDYRPQTYVVRPGDTLYGIAWRLDLDYHDLARWNHLGADYRISVGQILTLRQEATGSSAARSVVNPASGLESRPAAPATGSAPTQVPSGASTSSAPSLSAPMPNAQGWVWPTEHAQRPRPVQGGGVLLLGELGQPVRAAHAGRVAYVGSGIRGYGNLIIIKHGASLLTAYAHTRELAVREGQDVLGGQIIAQMGTGPHQIAALYFEVRLNGRPVDPLPYLQGAR